MVTVRTDASSRFSRSATALALAGVLLLPFAVQAQKGANEGAPKPAAEVESFEPKSGQAGKDVIWVPTPPEVVQAMLEMAEVKAGDKLVDLGSGDGRIAIAAAKIGAQSMGIEYNPDMVGLSRRSAARQGVDNVKFVQGDIFESEFSDVDVVTMYLLPILNERLRPKLLDMKPGTRVASHQFTMGNWKPDAKRSITGHDALFWVVPAKVGGKWRVDYSAPGASGELQLDLKQEYQEVEASGSWGSTEAKVGDLKLRGGDISFSVADSRGGLHRFAGTADHEGHMKGTVTDAGGRKQPFTANRITTVGSR